MTSHTVEALAEVEVRVVGIDLEDNKIRLRLTQYLDGKATRNTATNNQQSQVWLSVGDRVTVQMKLLISASGVCLRE